MTLAEIETAVRAGLRTIVLVFDNQRYGMIGPTRTAATASVRPRPTSDRSTSPPPGGRSAPVASGSRMMRPSSRRFARRSCPTGRPSSTWSSTAAGRASTAGRERRPLDPYEVLGVPRDASMRQIRAAYVARARRALEISSAAGDSTRCARSTRPGLCSRIRSRKTANGTWRTGPPAARGPIGRRGQATPMPPAASGRARWHPPGRPSGPVLQFGIFDGWSLGEISRRDQGYLLWLRDRLEAQPFQGRDRPPPGPGGRGGAANSRQSAAASGPVVAGRRALRRRGGAGRCFRGLHLGVLDLLEDLAHARPHEVAGRRVDIAVAAADPGLLAEVRDQASCVLSSGMRDRRRAGGSRQRGWEGLGRLRSWPTTRRSRASSSASASQAAPTARPDGGSPSSSRRVAGCSSTPSRRTSWGCPCARPSRPWTRPATRSPRPAPARPPAERSIADRPRPGLPGRPRGARRKDARRTADERDPPRTRPGAGRGARRREARASFRELRGVDGDQLRKLWSAWASVPRRRRPEPGPDGAPQPRPAPRRGRGEHGSWARRWAPGTAGAAGSTTWPPPRATGARGIATKLVDQVEAGLRDLGCPKVSVLVREENDDGRDFWKAAGTRRGSRQFARELARVDCPRRSADGPAARWRPHPDRRIGSRLRRAART